MIYALWAAAAIGIIYLFVSFVMFLYIFLRRMSKPLDQLDLARTNYAPYQEELLASMRELRALPSETVRIQAFDGVELAGHYYDGRAGRLVILIHGYRAPYINNFAVAHKWFRQQGYDILAIDQRAHGESGGHILTMGDREQRDIGLWLQEAYRRWRPQSIVLYGISMGAHALALAAEKMGPKDADALILDCGYISTYETVRHAMRQLPLFPAGAVATGVGLFTRLLAGFDIHAGDTTKALAHTCVPVFFLHGTADEVVPVENTDANYRACSAEKKAFYVEDAAHATAFLAGGQALKDSLRSFLDQNTGGETTCSHM